MAEPIERATRYEVSCLPESHELAYHMTISVEYRGRDRWAVMNRVGEALGSDGEWDWEPRPSERDDDWLETHRFTLGPALEIAKREAPKLTVKGRTAAEWLAQDEP